MDIFGLFGIVSFLNDMNTKRQRINSSSFMQEIDELSSELDYFLKMFDSYRNRAR